MKVMQLSSREITLVTLMPGQTPSRGSERTLQEHIISSTFCFASWMLQPGSWGQVILFLVTTTTISYLAPSEVAKGRIQPPTFEVVLCTGIVCQSNARSAFFDQKWKNESFISNNKLYQRKQCSLFHSDAREWIFCFQYQTDSHNGFKHPTAWTWLQISTTLYISFAFLRSGIIQ